MGGDAIFRVKPQDPNVSVILEMLTRHNRQTIMAQRFIPEIEEGDKRILMINGEPVPYCLARVPLVGETRGNLAAGGTGRPTTPDRPGSLDRRPGGARVCEKRACCSPGLMSSATT